MNDIELETVEYPAMQAAHETEAVLLHLVADLIAAHRSGNGNGNEKELDAALDSLVENMEAHFAMENDLMRRLGFPPYPAHAGEHHQVLQGVQQSVAQWKQRRDIDELSTALLIEHVQWMQRHVATMDHLTARFINKALATGRG